MSADAKWPWSVLGLPKATKDPAALRKAYARALKQIDQASDIAGFEALRAAYAAAQARLGVAPKGRSAAGRMDPFAASFGGPAQPDTGAISPADPPPPQQAAEGLGGGRTRPLAALPPAIAQAEALMDALNTPSLDSTASARLLAFLADPLHDDDSVRDMLRDGAIAFLQNALYIPRYGPKDQGATLDLDLRRREVLDALNLRFHWFSDYAALRRDLGLHANLKNSLMELHHGFTDHTPRVPPALGKTKLWARILAACAKRPQAIMTGFFVVCVVGIFLETMVKIMFFDDAGIPYLGVYTMIFMLVVVNGAVVILALVKTVLALKAWHERRQDAKAMRRKRADGL